MSVVIAYRQRSAVGRQRKSLSAIIDRSARTNDRSTAQRDRPIALNRRWCVTYIDDVHAGETVLVAMPGDVTGPVNNSGGVLLRWNVGCGNVHAPHMSVLEHLEQTAQDGRMSRDLQFPVAGLRVTNRAGRIKRSYVLRVRPTPTQLPVYPTRPTGSPVYPVITPSATPIDHGGVDQTQTALVSDGLQPSSHVTGATGQGRTTPLPSDRITKRPVIGGTNGASSMSGVSNSWLTVASSVLALTVVTLPTVDRTMRRIAGDDDQTPTTNRQTTTSADQAETQSTVERDAGRSPDTDRGKDWSEKNRDRSTHPTVDDDPTTRSQFFDRSTTRRVTWGGPRSRRPDTGVQQAPDTYRHLDIIVVNVGDSLLYHLANDTFIDYQVQHLSLVSTHIHSH